MLVSLWKGQTFLTMLDAEAKASVALQIWVSAAIDAGWLVTSVPKKFVRRGRD